MPYIYECNIARLQDEYGALTHLISMTNTSMIYIFMPSLNLILGLNIFLVQLRRDIEIHPDSKVYNFFYLQTLKVT